jgi:hypothetical protein
MTNPQSREELIEQISFLLDLLDEATRPPAAAERIMSSEDREEVLDFLSNDIEDMYRSSKDDAVERATYMEVNGCAGLVSSSDDRLLDEFGKEYVDDGGSFDLEKVENEDFDLDDRFMLWAKYRKPSLLEHLKLREATEAKISETARKNA